jgi:PAS domain S-box-containing protein
MDERDTVIESLKKENAALRREVSDIRESEERYKTLYDALPVSLELVDRDGTITGVNPFHLKNMGKGRTKESDYVGQLIATRPSIVASGLSEKLALVLKGVPFQADEVHFPKLSGGGEGYFNFRGVPLMRNGEIIGAIFISMDVTALHQTKDELQRHKEQLEELVEERTRDLRDALAKVKTLSGFIPICASCKKVRDDKGFWSQIEAYLSDHSELEFSHGLCPECARRLYPDYVAGT